MFKIYIVLLMMFFVLEGCIQTRTTNNRHANDKMDSNGVIYYINGEEHIGKRGLDSVDNSALDSIILPIQK